MQQVCVETQIALDKRARGAPVDSREQTLLAEHHPGCLVCRAFERTLEETENVMHAHAQVLRREVDLTALGQSARKAIARQKRGMIRGLVALAALVGLGGVLAATTGDTAILAPALGLLVIGGVALVGDFARLKLTRRWGQEAPRLDAAGARRERRIALGWLVVFAVLAFAPLPLPGAVGDGIATGLGVVGLVGVFHLVFVVRALSREISALRD